MYPVRYMPRISESLGMDTGFSTMGSVRKPGIVTVSPFLKKSSRFPPFAARTAASRSGTVTKLVLVR